MAEKISSSYPPAAQLHSLSASVSAVHISPLASKVEQLRTEIALLKDTLSSLQLPSMPFTVQITSWFPRIQSCTYTYRGQVHPLLVSSEVRDPSKRVSPCNYSQENAQARC